MTNEEDTNKQDKRIYTLGKEKPARAVVKMGTPLIAGMMIMVLYNLTDTFFIGLLRDDYQLAAVNLAYPVMMITIALSNMVGTGASTLIARSLGAGEIQKAQKTMMNGILLTAATGIALTMAGLILLDPIIQGLGAKEHTSLYTSQYVGILLAGTVCTMGNYTFGQLLRGEGSVKYSMLGMVCGTILNIGLDPVFIFAAGLQVRGAAIATILSNGIGMALSLWVYASGRAVLRPSKKQLRPDGEIIGEIYRVGIPAALETLLTSAAYIVCNNLAVAYGERTVAAMGIAQKILSLGNYIYQGFAAGVQPIMGYSFGAKNYRRMLDILKAGVLIVSGTELAVMAICGIFAPHLVGLFTGSGEVIATGSKALRALMCILPFVGATSMCRMSLQAMGRPMIALAITIVRQLVLYIPLLLLMDHSFGFGGLIWAQPITEVIMMAASISLLVRIIRTMQRLEKGEENA
ncbi:MAG: MATE family efflux transporter [Firmicutes bacterium]|nr:MATE family efflux transporter [Bacillota bacterium]